MTQQDILMEFLHDDNVLSVAESPHKLYQALSKRNRQRAFDGKQRQDIPYAIGGDVFDYAESVGCKVVFLILEK